MGLSELFYLMYKRDYLKIKAVLLIKHFTSVGPDLGKEISLCHVDSANDQQIPVQIFQSS